MKKISTFIVSAMTLLFASCSEATQEWHNTFIDLGFDPTSQQPRQSMLLYADQEYDTLKIFSFDPWKLETSGDSAWFTLSPTSGDARPGTPAVTRIDIRMPQNDTGRNRMNSIFVKSHDELGCPIYQNSWLNITRPTPRIDASKHFIYKTAKFAFQEFEAAAATEFVSFHVYQNDAKLTWESGNEWATFDDENASKEELTFNAGTHTIKLKIAKNDGAEREAKLLLTSGKITTPIYLKQAAKKDNK